MVTSEEKRLGGGEDMWSVTAAHFEPALRQALADLGIEPSTVGRVASLGYGMFAESGALDKVFPLAQIEGIDVEESGAVLQQKGKIPARISLRHEDLMSPQTLGESRYDLMVVRNPDVHRTYGWEKIFKNSFKALRNNGGVIVTGLTEAEIDNSANLLSVAGFKILSKGENPNAVPADKSIPNRDDYILVAKKP